MKGHEVAEYEGMFNFSQVVRTRGHPYKLEMPGFNTDIKKRSFPCRSVRMWNDLPSGVVEAGSLATFKGLLAGHLGDQLYEFV